MIIDTIKKEGAPNTELVVTVNAPNPSGTGGRLPLKILSIMINYRDSSTPFARHNVTKNVTIAQSDGSANDYFAPDVITVAFTNESQKVWTPSGEFFLPKGEQLVITVPAGGAGIVARVKVTIDRDPVGGISF